MQNKYIPKFAYVSLVGALVATLVGFGWVGVAPLAPASAASKTVTLVTHDSFVISQAQLALFTKQTGLTVQVVKAGDAGTMVNKLILTKNKPIGDAFFGVDNTLRNAALEARIVSNGRLTAIDYGDVCFNYDRQWFMQAKTVVPTSWKQLTDAKYRGMTVIENPNTSSTGLAFLATTVAAFGADYGKFWRALKANDVKVAAGWEDAYYTDFSGSSGKGPRPIVLSYSTSPAYEVREDGKSGTVSLSDGCFRQTEYAGVLAKAKNPNGAAKLVKFLQSASFQRSIPENMYMYPVSNQVSLPESWALYGRPAKNVLGSDLNFKRDRKKWLSQWNQIFG